MNISKLMRRTLVLTAMLMMCATPSVAQGPGWTAVSTVVSVVNTWGGGVNVRLSPELSDCVSQSGYGAYHASIYPDHPGINRIKADLLVALTTGAKIQLYFGDNTCRVLETILIAN